MTETPQQLLAQYQESAAFLRDLAQQYEEGITFNRDWVAIIDAHLAKPDIRYHEAADWARFRARLIEVQIPAIEQLASNARTLAANVEAEIARIEREIAAEQEGE